MPDGAAAPMIVIPLVVRYRIEAMGFYGSHASGEAIDPDEHRVLERFAQASAGAYDHIEAEAMRHKVEDLSKALEISMASPQKHSPR